MKFQAVIHHENGRSYNSDVELMKTEAVEHFMAGVHRSHSAIAKEHGNIVANMAMQLLGVKGVENIFVSPYQVSVYTKERAPWDKKIDRIVEKAFSRAEKISTIQENVVETPPKEDENIPPVTQGKVQIETVPNDKMRCFETNFELSRTRIGDFERPIRPSSEKYLKSLGVAGEKLVRSIFDIQGVLEVWVYPYELSIKIADLFSWTVTENEKTMEEKIIDIFHAVFGPDIVVSHKQKL